MDAISQRSAAELEGECLRALHTNPYTKDIRSVRIIRLCPRDNSGPNWTFGVLKPAPTRHGFGRAHDVLAPLHLKFALAD
jgi:hypothetical protein